MFNFGKKIKIIIFISLFLLCFSGRFVFAEEINITEENIKDYILDGFPAAVNNIYDSFKGVTNSLDTLSLQSDNPFSDEYDRSFHIANNEIGSEPMSVDIGPISENGFAMSWWQKGVLIGHIYTLSDLKIIAKDEDQNTLLGAKMGRNSSSVYSPAGSEGMNWNYNNIDKNQISDYSWHQIILTSDGINLSVFVDGVKKAEATLNNTIDFTGKNIRYLSIAESWIGHVNYINLDEIMFWDKHVTENDAQMIFESDSLVDEYYKEDQIIDVAVILAEPSDIEYFLTSTTTRPCKLIDEKTYQNGHDREYYKDLLYCVRDYHCENSFGTRNQQGECENGLVDLNFEIFDNNGSSYKLDKTEGEYVGKEKEFIYDSVIKAMEADFNNVNDKDIVIVVHPGHSKQVSEQGKLGTMNCYYCRV